MTSFVRGLIAGAVASVVVLTPFVCHSGGEYAPEIRKAQVNTRQAVRTRRAAVETVTVHVPVVAAARAESDRLAQLVRSVGPMTLEVRTTPTAEPERVEVPPAVVAKLRADSITIAEQGRHILLLGSLARQDSAVIASQQVEIGWWQRQKTPSRCQAKCGALLATGSIIVTAIAVKWTQDILRPQRPSMRSISR